MYLYFTDLKPMIKFFRKIRQNLLSEGKSRKYFKYAIGEIVLVVIGILIALQINNWNENNLKFNLENFINEENIKLATFGKPMRQLLTNNKDGLSINSIMCILGKDITIHRINSYIK